MSVRRSIPLLADGSHGRALLVEACQRAGVPLATLEALVAAEMDHVGQARRHGLPGEIDAILNTVLGHDPTPPPPSEIRAAMESAERDLQVYEAGEGDPGWHGERAAELAERTRTRIVQLRQARPQQPLVQVFVPRARGTR